MHFYCFFITHKQKNRGYNGEIIIGGVPLNEVNETNLMQRVVLVRHNSYLFKGTVEENLKMAKPDATKEEMEAVLQKVNLLGFLHCLLYTSDAADE